MNTLPAAPTRPANADPGEIAKFGKLAHHWWDPDSALFGPLHRMYPVRLEAGGTWWKVTRGKLAGAADWTDLYGSSANTGSAPDELVRNPLGVLWYGEPGSEHLVDRHARSVSPLSVNGRLFVQGEERIQAYDNYNGTLLWERQIPGAVRVRVDVDGSNLSAPGDALFVATHSTRRGPSAGGARVEVIEFFSYACPFCYEAEPHITRWLMKREAQVELKRVPSVLPPGWAPFARIYYALEATGMLARLHWPVFDNHNFDGRRLNDEKNLLDWMSRNGADALLFKQAMDSAEVRAKMDAARTLLDTYNIQGVPSFVVDGRYLTSSRLAGGIPEMMSVVDHLVELTDTGIGVSRENLPKLIDPFFSTKSTGLGLGLAMTSRVIEEHGGKGDFQSAEGRGSTVTIYLPV